MPFNHCFEQRDHHATSEQHFIQAYLASALWSSMDEEGNPLDDNHDLSNIHPDCIKELISGAKDFYWEYETMILSQDAPLSEYWDGATDNQRKASMAGHDFWLTVLN